MFQKVIFRILSVVSTKKKTREPNQSRSIETKEKIISAANELFAELGYYKTNTKLIAKQAGVPVGSIYAYFKDKKEILLESIRIGHEKISRNMSERDLDPDTRITAEQFIRSIMESNIETHRLLPVFHRDMKFLRNTETDIREYLEESEQRSYEQTKEILRSASHLVHVEDIEAAAVVVHRTIENFTHFLCYEESPVEKERIITQVTAMLTSYLSET